MDDEGHKHTEGAPEAEEADQGHAGSPDPEPPPAAAAPGPDAPEDVFAPDPLGAGTSGEDTAEGERLRRQAEIEARVIRDAAVRSAQQITSEAQRDARVRLRDAADHVAAVLERLEERETELSQVIGGLRSEAGRLAADIHILREAAADAQADTAAPPERSSAPPPPASAPREPEEGDAGGSSSREPPHEPTASAGARNGEPDGDSIDGLNAEKVAGIDQEVARLVALNMAFDGTPRDQAARYLERAFALEDPSAVLDEVYARAGAHR